MSLLHAVNHASYESLMRYARVLGYGDVHTKIDRKTGLTAIVAIHNLKRGPAIGGCRMIAYPTINYALEDALRLGYMMSFKAAITNLPHGGAKSVILLPTVIKDREALFEKFGEFVEELGGRYIAAVDSGTSPVEMDIIARKTNFVTCTTASSGLSDPSPMTALGVRRGMEAAVRFHLNRDSLAGVRVAIQGAGHVGYYLAKDLVQLGAIVTIADTREEKIKSITDELPVTTCAPDAIFDADVDVFAPCAMGAVLNHDTIHRLKATVVAGAANNQLAHAHYGTLMHERGILYAPDFLINSGGLIYVATLYEHKNKEKSVKQIEHIFDAATDIFEQSARENIATNIIAERIAKERLG